MIDDRMFTNDPDDDDPEHRQLRKDNEEEPFIQEHAASENRLTDKQGETK